MELKGIGEMTEEIKALAQTTLAYRDMLVKHVWHKRASDGKYFCIECGNVRENGHASNCALATLLKEA